MIEKLVEAAIKYCERRGKVVNITGTAGPDDVYMIRHMVMKNRFCNIYIHQFLRSDRDDLHDHPWHFATFLVRGAYTERKWNPRTEQIDSTRRTTTSNRFVWRKATDQHQVVVDRDLKPSEKGEAALTLFVSGPIIREWGFIREVMVRPFDELTHTINMIYAPIKIRRWIPWRKYLGLPENTPPR